MQASGRRCVQFAVLGLLVLAAAGEFAVRGPVRFLNSSNFNDFISPFTQTRAWLKGRDPFSPATLVDMWPTGVNPPDFLKQDLSVGRLVQKRGIPTAYPPTSFVLLAPFALISPWRLTVAVWMVCCLLLYFSATWAFLRVCGFGLNCVQGWLFLAFALALAPVHSGLATGSIVIPVVGICALAVLAAEVRRDIWAGILIAAAVSLKPQIGLPMLVYYCLQRRWRVARTATLLTSAMGLIAIARLQVSHTPWLSSYLYDNRVLFSPGSLGDFTELNPLRFGLVNLQVSLYAGLGNRAEANIAALTVFALLGAGWLYCVQRAETHELDLLQLATVCCISLLPIYHRFYDASVLVFPLAWALLVLSRRYCVEAGLTLVLISAFFIPGGTILEQLQRDGRIPGTLANNRWWSMFVMAHEVWIILLLSIVLLRAMWLEKGTPNHTHRPELGKL